MNEPSSLPGTPLQERQIALIDLLDRLLAGGVVLTGDLTLAIADVDLVRISLRALITSVEARLPARLPSEEVPSP
ncbi:gas vesicle protein [Streptomyces sp. ME03-5709C]|nr:gas vesicle protein [Streptomyces sp. ME03-5709C]